MPHSSLRVLLLAFAFSCGRPDDACDDTFFADADEDGHGDAESVTTACSAPVGYVASSDDCDDADATIHPGVDELCNTIDDDCDGVVDESAIDGSIWYADLDGDGFGSDVETVACTQPGGHVGTSGDCVDYDAAVNPDADELCNDVDDDCDGLVDSLDPSLVQGVVYYADADGDAYGDPTTGAHACEEPTDRVLDSSDCDDADALVHPLADEVCDLVDDDCDGLTDIEDDDVQDPRAFYVDMDGDGLGNSSDSIVDCFGNGDYVATEDGDCDDTDASVGEALDYYMDADGDGYGAGALTATCTPGSSDVLVDGDCRDEDDTIHPGATEICNHRDDNCDGLLDDEDPLIEGTSYFADADGDGYGDALDAVVACSLVEGRVTDATDCNDADATISPGAFEWCDGIDNDCDTTVDGDVLYIEWYADADGDAYGDASVVQNDCVQPSGYVAIADDCDDTAATTNPSAEEICATGVDENCDLSVDNCTLSSADADVFVLGPAVTFGQTIAPLDMDADATADLVLSSWFESDQSGVVYIARGPVTAGTTLDDMVQLVGDDEDGGFGWKVAGGDVDGDLFDDLLVGAPSEVFTDVYLFLGPVTDDGERTDADAIFDGERGTSAGFDIDVVTDFDGDDAVDVAISAPDADRAYGAVYVLAGDASGTVDLATESSYVFEGAARSGALGTETDTLGDTNGDGVADLALGANSDGNGTVYVVEGGDAAGTYTVDTAAVASLGGPEREASFGSAIASGDFDLDGTTDLFVGAPWANATTHGDGGAVYAFLGPLSGELDTDDAVATWTPDDSEVAGFGSDLDTGDVDGDKQLDVVMGAYYAGPGQPGAVYLQMGPASGTVVLSSIVTIEGQMFESLGTTIALVPDWTGDDGAEVALGGPEYRDDVTDDYFGALYVFDSGRFYP